MAEKTQREKLEEYLVGKAVKDPAFAKNLKADPVGTIEKEFKIEIPEDQKINVLEETANMQYLIIPYAYPEKERELSDAELEKVAGGYVVCWFWSILK